VRLDGPERTSGLDGDLLEAQLTEEPQRDHLSIRLVEPADGRPDSRRALGAQGREGRVLPARQVDPGGRIGRVDPGDVAPALGATKRDPDRDPGQPGTERAVAPPGSQAPEGGHEGLLRRILGFMEVTEDAVAGPLDRWTLAFDEEPERVAIAGQDGIDSGAFIGDLGADGWGGDW